MKTKIRIVGWMVLLALSALNQQLSTTSAQGTAFTYQGRLNDANGPANGIYDARFTVCDALANGSVVGGPLTNSATAVTNGLFTVTLDFGGGVFYGNARWLEIAVRTNGAATFTTLAPRQALTATPYAIQALTATSAATAASANSVSAANITGPILLPQLPSVLVTNGASGLSLTGTFSGDGAGLAGVDLLSANLRGAIAWTTNAWSMTALPVGQNPQAVVAADMNGDGKLDLITANHNDSSLTIWNNNGHGGFVNSATISLGLPPNSLATADVNGDGKLDLICAVNSPNVPQNGLLSDPLMVLTNDGSGGFKVSSLLPTGNSLYWYSAPDVKVAVADFNGDGKPDLIAANANDSSLTVFTNDGTGGFAAGSTNYLDTQPWTIATADVNGDGKADVILGGEGYPQSAVTVLTNDGRGGFVIAVTIPMAATPGWGLTYVTAADVNGDGKPDLITADLYNDTLTVLTNNGSGGFVQDAVLAVGAMQDWLVPDSVAVVDLNHNGKMDLVCTKQAGGITVFSGDGHGGFVAKSSLPTGSQPGSVTVADLNGDGKLSVICANTGDNSLSVIQPDTPSYQATFAGNGAGLTGINATNITAGTLPIAQLPANLALLDANQTFTGQNTFNQNVTVIGTVIANAFQGDGSGLTLNLDLHSANTHGLISWTTNTTFTYTDSFLPISTNVFESDPYAVVAADVNHDGKMDLISILGGVDHLTVSTNAGSGGFATAQTTSVGLMPVSLVAADINGDGFVDLITANFYQGNLTVLTNDGSGGLVLASSPYVGNPFESYPKSITAADVNNDGKLDLICADVGDGILLVLSNVGNGHFVTSSSPSVGNGPVSVVAADVNHDGWVDLICANRYDNTLTVLTNDGHGYFVTAATPVVGNTPLSVVAADVNHDGWADLICANFDDNTLTVLTNDGSGGFVTAATPGAGNTPVSVAAADVNQDGWVDLICANQNGSTLTVLTNNGSGGFGISFIAPVGNNPVCVVAADVNGDHHPDLISANADGLTVLTQEAHPQASYQAGLNASSITTGTLPVAQLPASVVTNNASGLNLSGAFIGDGSGLSNLTFSVTGDLTGQRLNIGVGNTLSGDQSSIAGGLNNTANADYATVAGGTKNTAGDTYATVAGGYQNQATGHSSFIGGGSDNIASNSFATVPGGQGNVAGGVGSFAAGSHAKALHDGAFVWADHQPRTIFASTADDQFLIRASGGVGINTNDTSGAALTVAGTIKADNIFQWEVAAGTTVQAQPNTGYIANNADLVTVTLPASPNVGDTVRVTGTGGGGWKIAQNAGQSILIGNLGSLSDGLIWTAQTNSGARNWSSVASSADGTKLVADADRIYTSTDSGVTWTPRDSAVFWGNVASSADGTKLVATSGNGHFYTSTDSGVTWTPRGSNNCYSVASSADGNKLVAAADGGQIYTSTDSGATWTPRASNRNWKSVASSADGTKLVAGADRIYTSTDSGATWTPQGGNSGWISVASSSDGSRLVAIEWSPVEGYISVSTDSGVTWKQRGSARFWQFVASSADGRKLVALEYHGRIYTSTDSGVTWTVSESNRDWNSVASSADGCKLAAAVYNGTIYTTSFGNTTVGSAGGLTGGQRTAVELQYIGNNQFLPISYVGTVLGY